MKKVYKNEMISRMKKLRDALNRAIDYNESEDGLIYGRANSFMPSLYQFNSYLYGKNIDDCIKNI